jgi:hypothetical protein
VVALGGLEVACLILDPRITGSNPADDDGFLRVIKICITTSLRGEVKPSVTSDKILQLVKKPYEYETDTRYAKFRGHFFTKFLCFTTRCICW